MSHTTAELKQQLDRRRSQLAQKAVSNDLVIGKDILELLSTAMYLDPLTIFREYVQNAADAIDRAYDEGLLRGEHAGRITMTLDTLNREIRIRDNGIGVKQADAERVLTAFGASAKRGTSARGFRGVGRLAALGYAQFVVFRCKAAGDPVITEVRWDCRRLKSILRDGSYAGDLADVVSDVVSVSTVSGTDAADHFFEVVLERVVRIRNDVLLNDAEVRKYLSQVAPAPFSDDFPFGTAVMEHIGRHVPPCRFRIYLNDLPEHLVRPFTDGFVVGQEKSDRFTRVELLELKDAEGRTRAVGWMLDHSYLGAIHGAPEIRGLRARVGDIQIGGDSPFLEAFPESRFNSWTVGELHVVDRQLVPNGRRDDFEQSPAYFQLLGELMPLGRDVARKCRASSAKRNRLRAFELRAEKVEQLTDRLEQNAVNRAVHAATRREAGGLLGEMAKVLDGELILDAERLTMVRQLKRLRRRLEIAQSAAAIEDPLRSVAPKKRAVYEEVIGLIYECSQNRVAAKALVDRIVARLATLT